MPNIEVPKTDTNLGFQLSDRAADSSALAGRRIAQNYNETAAAIDKAGAQIGSGVAVAKEAVIKYQEHQEISQGALGFAKLKLALTREWDDRAKDAAQRDPNDPSVGPEFHEKILEPSLDRFRSAFRTQGGVQWAEHQVDALRNHMFEKTAADMSTIAGHAAVVNHTQMVNTLSTNAMEDPGAVKSLLKDYDVSVGALAQSNPNMTALQVAKFQEELSQKGKENIVRSAVFGAIQKNPDTGLKLAQDPDLSPYISGMEVKQFETYARTQQRIAEYDVRNKRQAEKQEVEDKNDETMRNLLPRLFSDKPDVSREELNRLMVAKELSPRAYEHATNIMKSADSGKLPPGAADQRAVDLIMDVRAGKITNMDPIYDALGKREIDYPRFKQVENELRNFKNDDGTPLSQARQIFSRDYSHVVNPPDTNNQRQYPEREFALYQAMRRQEALAREGPNHNPNDAYNKDSPFFIGKQPEAQPISPWQIRQDEQRRGNEARAKEPAPPKPDWLGAYKDQAQWDAAAKSWAVTVDGKKKFVRENK